MTSRRKWLVVTGLCLSTALAITARSMNVLEPRALAVWLDPAFCVTLLLALAFLYGPAILVRSEVPWFLPVCLLCVVNCIIFVAEPWSLLVLVLSALMVLSGRWEIGPVVMVLGGILPWVIAIASRMRVPAKDYASEARDYSPWDYDAMDGSIKPEKW